MPQLSVADFLSLLRQSHVISARQWAELRQEMLATANAGRSGARSPDAGPTPKSGSFDSTADVVDWLIARGWVTRWQADMLLAGRTTLFLGQYRLLECVGTGGMGAVFKARHGRMGRTVALKVMSAAIVQDAKAVARFRNEIQAAAALNHPNIVAAYDANCAGKMHFLVMEYVDGHDLGWYVNQEGLLPIAWVCECIAQAALGLQHAHERGMVHRDIKPTNVLVARDPETGRPHAKLLDLGLARFASEADSEFSEIPLHSPAGSELTQANQVLGTPDYIAPEQAANTRRADARSDIYSLGCTLFRLLTGEFPFPGNSAAEKIKARQMGRPPRSLRELRPEASPELEAVVMKMMAREPKDRYQSAQEVAVALAPFGLTTDGALLQLPPPPTAERSSGSNVAAGEEGRLKEFFTELTNLQVDDALEEPAEEQPSPPSVARRPRLKLSARACIATLASLGGTLLVAALWYWISQVGLVVDWPAEQRAGGSLTVDGRAIDLPPEGELRVKGRPGRWDVRLTRPGFESIRLALDLSFGEIRPVTPEWRPTAKSRRLDEWASLNGRAAALESADPRSQPVVDLRRDLTEFRSRVSAFDEADAAVRLLARLPAPLDSLSRGTIPALSLQSAGLTSRDAAPAALIAVLGDARFKSWNTVTSTSISRDGRFVAAAGLDGFVRIFIRETGMEHQVLRPSTQPREVLFSPSENLLAVAGTGFEVALWDVETGDLRPPLRQAGAPLAFSRDGALLAAGAPRQEIAIIELPAGRVRQTLPGHPKASLRTLTFSPDALRLASYGSNATVALWDLSSNAAPRRFLQAHRPRFSPDGRWLAAGSGDLRLWSTDGSSSERTFKNGGDPLAFAADGRSLVSYRAGRAMVWDVEAGMQRLTLAGVPSLAAVSPDATWLAAAKENAADLRFWNLSTGESVGTAECRSRIGSLAFTPDSARLITAGSDFAVRQWDAATGRETQSAGPAWGPVACDPDGRFAAVAQKDKIEVWDLTAPERPIRALGGEFLDSEQLSWSPQGRWIAGFGGTGFYKLSLRMWDSSNGSELALGIQQTGALRKLAFSPAGERLAIASDGPQVLLWDITKQSALYTLDDAPANTQALAIDRRQRWLAAAGDADTVVLWNLQTRSARPLATVPKAGVRKLSFSADGSHLIAAAARGLLVWEVPGGKLVRTLACKPGAPTCVSLSPTGDRLAAAGTSGTIWLWNCPSGKAPAEEPEKAMTIGPPGGLIRDLSWSCDNRHLLTVNANSTLYALQLTEDDGPGN